MVVKAMGMDMPECEEESVTAWAVVVVEEVEWSPPCASTAGAARSSVEKSARNAIAGEQQENVEV